MPFRGQLTCDLHNVKDWVLEMGVLDGVGGWEPVLNVMCEALSQNN